MDVSVVSSFSLDGWNKYGARFVETFNHFWPKPVDLHLVSEDNFELERNDSGRNIKIWSLYESPYAKKFLNTYQSEPWASGDATVPKPEFCYPWKQSTGYSFRHDAYKFSKKVFAIDLVARSMKNKRLFWVDADTVTFEPVPFDLFDQVLPRGYAISYLGRPAYHSECGFVGYNLRETQARDFIKEFARLYVSGKVFTLAEWHDSWVFDWLRASTKVASYAIPHSSNQHPFINSVLGRYMDHLKGARKKQGHSNFAEQRKHRDVHYWGRR